MAANRAPRASGAAEVCAQQPLDLFKNRLPSRPLCGDEKSVDGALYLHRLPLLEALERLHIQPNTAKRYVSLCFDVDREGAAIDWNDRNAPPPNMTVKNPANGHAHLIYLLTAPVAVSDVARIQPVLFMAAIQEGLRRALEADRGYAGVVVKNPAHKHWQTHTWRAEPYLLEELAEYVALPSLAEMKKRSKQPDYAGLGRNCTVFEIARTKSYNLVRDYWKPNGAVAFAKAVLELVEASNHTDIGKPLDVRECRAIARSISKWTWQHFTPAKFREIQKARGQRKGAEKRKELLPTAQSMAAEGKSLREIGEALGVSFKTVGNWLKSAGV
ncbi:replication initiation protein (plasmid) [Pseudomonas fragi]|nr:replication initiation protein [Pseudomonas fragi]WOL30539.1 replication initiation protein [Pseudomonas fragi]